MSTSDGTQDQKLTIYTIGFTKKSAQTFFDLLRKAGVKRVIDIRLNNESQLAGFSKKDDLQYFLRTIANVEYIHSPNLAPTKEILDGYRNKKLSWVDYERQFLILMRERKVENLISPDDLDQACLLCSEPKADKCHRRLVAEYLKSKWGNVVICHL